MLPVGAGVMLTASSIPRCTQLGPVRCLLPWPRLGIVWESCGRTMPWEKGSFQVLAPCGPCPRVLMSICLSASASRCLC